MGFYDTPGNANGVAVAGIYAYVADGMGGLRVVNIADKAAPADAGFYDTPGNANGVAAAAYYTYVADGNGGLAVFHLTSLHPLGTLQYLPTLSLNHLSYFPGPNEVEPNNTAALANGPLQSGLDYHGYHNDVKDYFSFYMLGTGNIAVDLTNTSGQGVQLLIYYQVADAAHRLSFVPNAPFHIGLAGQPAGQYYIEVFTAGGFNMISPYRLRVTYP